MVVVELEWMVVVWWLLNWNGWYRVIHFALQVWLQTDDDRRDLALVELVRMAMAINFVP